MCLYKQQNGVVERKNRHLLDVACSIMFHMSLKILLGGCYSDYMLFDKLVTLLYVASKDFIFYVIFLSSLIFSPS